MRGGVAVRGAAAPAVTGLAAAMHGRALARVRMSAGSEPAGACFSRYARIAIWPRASSMRAQPTNPAHTKD